MPAFLEENAKTTELVATPGANFKGSFAPDSRSGPSADLSLVHPRQQAIIPFLTSGWGDVNLYKAAFVEMTGTMLLNYITAIVALTFVNFGSYIPAWVAITNVTATSVFIFATAAPSGGHLNPLITWATLLTGLTSLPRAVIYMIAQLIGATLAGALLRGSLDRSILIDKSHFGGCYWDHKVAASVTYGQAFVIEMTCSFVLLFLAFGCALDPRSGRVFGPILGPFLVALSLALVTFGTSGMIMGFPGAGMNPTRCFTYAVGRGEFQDQWLWWVGPATGGILVSIVYRVVPPYNVKTMEGAPLETSQSVQKGGFIREGGHEKDN